MNDEFILIENFRGPIEDDYYIEGALELCIDGIMISNLRYHDLIDQLWAYIIQCLEKIAADEPATTYWPDQPIKLAMTPVYNNKLMIERSGSSDPDVKFVADKLDVMDGLLHGAHEFFTGFLPFCIDGTPSDALKSIEALKLWRLKAHTVQPYD